LQITVSKNIHPAIGADEGYSLKVTSSRIQLRAVTTLGALHGLETLFQLLAQKNNAFYFPAVSIQDQPRFNWRGLMIDVSRHYIPIDVLKRNIDAMAAVKMNVLHLHLSDNEGFRVESKTFPELQGKGSNGEYYTQPEIRQLILYAAGRGIVIVPEFDMPGHSKSWFAGYPELASAAEAYEPGPALNFHHGEEMNLGSIMKLINSAPFPTMDPTKESTYLFLDKFIAEMSALFPSPYIHIGADENNGVAWKNNPSIVEFMKKNNIPNTHALQAYFVSRVKKILTKYHKQMIGWEEIFSKGMSEDVTIQVWQNGSVTKQALENGNPVLISKGFYLDLFMPAYIYYNNPDLLSDLHDSVSAALKGGEAAQWTEMADQTNIETRIWPRAGAVAERLWSPASVRRENYLYRRLFKLSEQLDNMGLQHITDYERSLRQIACEDYPALKNLTDVLTPVKGYKKLFANLMKPEAMSYQTAPLIQISDIVPVDSKVKWEFRGAVDSYLRNKDSVSEHIIRTYLIKWLNNHDALNDLFANSAILKNVESHSKDLSMIAAIGLDALGKLKQEKGIDADNLNKTMDILKTAARAEGETELCIIPEIEALVNQKMSQLPDTYPVFER
jgi:hexosaminidase